MACTRSAGVLLVLGLTWLLVAAPPVRSDSHEGVQEKPWSIEIEPYLWVASLDGKVGSDQQLVATSIPFSDIVKNLKMAAMGHVGLRYRRVGILADFNYVKLRQNFRASIPIFQLTGVTDIDVTTKQAFGTAAAYYRFAPSEGLSLAPYVGARWWLVQTGVRANPLGLQIDPERSWADPVFGLVTLYDITDRWFVEAIGDVGGGVSKVTWQAYGGTGFNFKPWFALSLGWRYLGVDYDRDGFVFDTTTQGMLAGFKFRL